MIVINKVEDVPLFIGCPKLTEFLKSKVSTALKALETDSLEKYGSIYVIQTEDDWNLSNEINISKELKYMPVEYTEQYSFLNSHGSIEIYHGCFCISNDFSFDVYCPSYMIADEVFHEWNNNLVGGKNEI